VTQEAQEYISIDLRPAFRRQAYKVWLVCCGIALFWSLLIVLPPIAKANGFAAISSPLYGFFSYICHQMPDRSFHVEGEPFGVCSRCFGVYFGILLGFAVYPLWRRIAETRPIPRFWLFLSLVPITIDWSLTMFGIWENTFTSRFITGLVLGVACATFVMPAAVEITQNLTLRAKKAALTAASR
jgi:uncharacterized membrane protein